MDGWDAENIAAAVLCVIAIAALIYASRLGGHSSKRSGGSRKRFTRHEDVRDDVTPIAPWHQNARPRIAPIADTPIAAPQPDASHFGQQLGAVMEGAFQKRRIMNTSEYRVFRIVELLLADSGHRVFAQPCLGEVLQSTDELAFRAINSKRVDMLIVDGGGWPVLAVEYQGEGHYQGTAAARDAIKKEALRKAGVRYAEIVPADGDEQIRARVREYLGWDKAVPPSPSVAPAQMQPHVH